MSIDNNSSVAEVRSELDRKRRRALDLQTSSTDPNEWNNLNTIRWDLEDLDTDLYLSQFIKNNDKLEILIGQIQKSGEKAEKIAATLQNVSETLQKARAELKNASAMFGELDCFYKEIDELIKTLREE
jgi:DNA repair ATPase RecN